MSHPRQFESASSRADPLAEAAQPFSPWLGEIDADDLRALLRSELGHERALEDFQPRGDDGGGRAPLSRAIAPGTILHVISGNTPHAGLQSLLRGLLLGSHNLGKLPGGGLPEVPAFRDRLPAVLAARVELSETLPDAWVEQADAIVVFGSDATVDTFRRRARPDQIFLGHGHRVSFGLVFCDPEFASVPGAARDASVFDQRGCLSPHAFYVSPPDQARPYAEHLASAMERFNREHPRGLLSAAEGARIHALREDWRFRVALDPARTALWESTGSTDWTVVFDASDPVFIPSPLDRVVFVKPLPPLVELPAALAPVRGRIGAVGLWPATPENARELGALRLGASRFCAIGQMQTPPLTWRQDGRPSLGSLVRWVDFEPPLPL